MEILDELREYLKVNKLSGESQKIDRQLTDFVSSLSSQNKLPKAIADPNVWCAGPDSVHVLCFSFLMLNTDLHVAARQHQGKNTKYSPMSLDNFKKNLRGVVNLSDEEFKQIYDDIAGEEIAIQKE